MCKICWILVWFLFLNQPSNCQWIWLPFHDCSIHHLLVDLLSNLNVALFLSLLEKQCRFLVMGVSCSKEIAISFSVPFKWDRLSTSGGDTSATCLLLKYRMADHNGSFVSGVLMCSLLILNKQEAIILFWGISPLSRTVDVDRIHWELSLIAEAFLLTLTA